MGFHLFPTDNVGFFNISNTMYLSVLNASNYITKINDPIFSRQLESHKPCLNLQAKHPVIYFSACKTVIFPLDTVIPYLNSGARLSMNSLRPRSNVELYMCPT